jgi:hypothetical protein
MIPPVACPLPTGVDSITPRIHEDQGLGDMRDQPAGRHPSAGPSFVAMSVRIWT